MGFSYERIKGSRFETFDALCRCAEEEKCSMQRHSLGDLLSRGARFYDDHSFGLRGEGLQMNEEGLRAFCSLMKVPFNVVTTIEKEGLASDLLNDMLGRSATLAELRGHDLVTNARANLISGVISGSYVTYSNHDLLRDLASLISHPVNGLGSGLSFETGYLLNTKLRVRFRSEIEAGVLRGKDRNVKDVTAIGLQFVNSMTGDTAVRIEFYLHRLVCANGLIAPVTHTESVVFHSGNERNFVTRLGQRLAAVQRGVGNIIGLLEMLADIDFNPRALAVAGFTSEILDICPEYRDRLRREGTDLKLPEDMSKQEKQAQREAAILQAIPSQLATGNSAKVFQSHWRENKTLFDFINLFTEKAKESQEIRERIAIEEKAGLLANRLFRNRKKLCHIQTCDEKTDHHR